MNTLEAVEQGDFEALQELLESGADIDELHDGWSPLMYAAASGDLRAAQYLVENGADIEVRFEKSLPNLTALGLAAKYGRTEVVEMLLRSGADPNATEKDGTTLLMLVLAEKPCRDVVDLLLSYGADVDAKTANGINALMIATFQGLEELADLLKEHGAGRIEDPDLAKLYGSYIHHDYENCALAGLELLATKPATHHQLQLTLMSILRCRPRTSWATAHFRAQSDNRALAKTLVSVVIQMKVDLWETMLLQVTVGDVPSPKGMRLARSAVDRCQLLFYSGAWLSATGQKTEAAKAFQAAMDERMPCLERDLAKHELLTLQEDVGEPEDAIRARLRGADLSGGEVEHEGRDLSDAVSRIWDYVRIKYSDAAPRINAYEVHSHEWFLPPQIELNANCDGVAYIVIDYRYFNFIYGLNAALSVAFLEPDGRRRSAQVDDSDARRIVGQFFRFHDGLLSLLDEGKARAPKVGTETPERKQLECALGYGQTIFVLAHEYAHYLLGHVGGAPCTSWRSRRGVSLQAEAGVRAERGLSQMQELDADELAAEITVGVLNGDLDINDYERNAALAGVGLLFEYWRIAELLSRSRKNFSLMSRLSGGEGRVPGMEDTHPASAARCQVWRLVNGPYPKEADELHTRLRSIFEEAVGRYDSVVGR